MTDTTQQLQCQSSVGREEDAKRVTMRSFITFPQTPIRRRKSEMTEGEVHRNALKASTKELPSLAKPPHDKKPPCCMDTEKDERSTSMLTDDLLLLTLSFFIGMSAKCQETKTNNDEKECSSDDGNSVVVTTMAVDEDALLSCMLVCKRWNRIANSQMLWRQQQRPTAGAADRRSSIIWSLNIVKEKQRTCQSLIGFAKRRTNRLFHAASGCCGRSTNRTSWYYDITHHCYTVVERATGKEACLIIPKQANEWKPPVVRRLFAGHFLRGGEFLRPGITPYYPERADTGIPSGVYLWNHRLIQWFPPEAVADGSLRLPAADAVDTAQDLKSILDLCGRHCSSAFICRALSGFDEEGTTSSSSLSEHLLWLEREEYEKPRQCQGNIGAEAWAKIVDWVMEIVEVFDLKPCVGFRAISYFDRLLRHNQNSSGRTASSPPFGVIGPGRYQLAAGVCLFLAAAGGSVNFGLMDAMFCADNTFALEDCFTCIEHALQSLNYRLAHPTALDFVEAYLREGLREDATAAADDNPSSTALAIRYVAEMALQTHASRHYRPSLVAACAVAVGLYLRGSLDIWPDDMARLTGLSWLDLEGCVNGLCRSMFDVQRTLPELTIVRRRYETAVNNNNASHMRQGETTGGPVQLPTTIVGSMFFALSAYRQRHAVRRTQNLDERS